MMPLASPQSSSILSHVIVRGRRAHARHCSEDRLSRGDGQNEDSRFRRSPTGPSVAPPRKLIDQPPASPWAAPPPPPQRPAPPPAQGSGRQWPIWPIVIFALLLSSVGIQAWRDLSRPDAWDY